MDHQTFDRLTRLFGIAGSRRTAWRALLGAALLGATTRVAMADSSTACLTGNQELCGRQCCPGKCFVGDVSGLCAICCTGKDRIICGDKCCKALDEKGDPCGHCVLPDLRGDETCGLLISGSYRRR